MKKKFAVIIFLSLVLETGIFCGPKSSIKNGTILQCWCWSFKTIEEKLPEISAAGFTAIQTSPINTCLVGEKGGLELMGLIRCRQCHR